MAFHSPRIYCSSTKEKVVGRVKQSAPEQCGDSRDDKSSHKSLWPSPFLGSTLDAQVREYVIALRATSGVVNTAIVLAAAEGIVAATDCSFLRQHGGSLVLTKAWAKSLINRMGFVKRKGSTMLPNLVSRGGSEADSRWNCHSRCKN